MRGAAPERMARTTAIISEFRMMRSVALSIDDIDIYLFIGIFSDMNRAGTSEP